jgi:hypothetical protein
LAESVVHEPSAGRDRASGRHDTEEEIRLFDVLDLPDVLRVQVDHVDASAVGRPDGPAAVRQVGVVDDVVDPAANLVGMRIDRDNLPAIHVSPDPDETSTDGDSLNRTPLADDGVEVDSIDRLAEPGVDLDEVVSGSDPEGAPADVVRRSRPGGRHAVGRREGVELLAGGGIELDERARR